MMFQLWPEGILNTVFWCYLYLFGHKEFQNKYTAQMSLSGKTISDLIKGY